MRTIVVVVALPADRATKGVCSTGDLLTIQQLVTQAIIKAFCVAIVPEAVWLNVKTFHPQLIQPP